MLAAFWISKALPVWPNKVRSARLVEKVEVAPMVATALVETLEVPTTNWSVRDCSWTIVPVSVKPETLAAVMDPHKRLPVASVVRAEEPEQEVCKSWMLPPENLTPLAKVEVAAVPVRFKLVAETPPVKVEVAVPVTIRLVMVVVPPAIVEEALKTPLTWSGPTTVDDPVEIYPPVKLAKPDTDKVDEADNGPATCSEPAMVEEA